MWSQSHAIVDSNNGGCLESDNNFNSSSLAMPQWVPVRIVGDEEEAVSNPLHREDEDGGP